jgi:hypothetical protein
MKVGLHPEEARATLWRGLRLETFMGRASRIVTAYTDGTTEHLDHMVPCDVWRDCPTPPFGHTFWTAGNIRVPLQPIPDGATAVIGGRVMHLPFGALLPVVTVTGLKIPTLAVIALGGVLARVGGRGRRKGVGGYAKDDGPLIDKMHRLLSRRSPPSLHAAAVAVAEKAKGSRQLESKVRRLMDRYRQKFPTLT